MAQEMPGFSYTGIADVDLTGKAGYGVVITATNTIALAGASAVIDGVLRYEGKAGESVTVVKTGAMGLVLGGPVTAGDQLATAAGGTFIKAIATKQIVAVSRENGLANEIHQGLLGYKGLA